MITKTVKTTRHPESINVECRTNCSFNTRLKMFKCQSQECLDNDIWHHGTCFGLSKIKQKELSEMQIKCSANMQYELITADVECDDIVNVVGIKPFVLSTLNIVHSHLPHPMSFSNNAVYYLNYGTVFKNGIDPAQILSDNLQKINQSLSGISFVTISGQFKDKKMDHMNNYERPEVICYWNAKDKKHEFTNISFIKRPSAQRNESRRYHILCVQENCQSPQLYSSIRFDYYTNRYGHEMRLAFDPMWSTMLPSNPVYTQQCSTNNAQQILNHPTQLSHQGKVPSILNEGQTEGDGFFDNLLQSISGTDFTNELEEYRKQYDLEEIDDKENDITNDLSECRGQYDLENEVGMDVDDTISSIPPTVNDGHHQCHSSISDTHQSNTKTIPNNNNTKRIPQTDTVLDNVPPIPHTDSNVISQLDTAIPQSVSFDTCRDLRNVCLNIEAIGEIEKKFGPTKIMHYLGFGSTKTVKNVQKVLLFCKKRNIDIPNTDQLLNDFIKTVTDSLFKSKTVFYNKALNHYGYTLGDTWPERGDLGITGTEVDDAKDVMKKRKEYVRKHMASLNKSKKAKNKAK